MALYTFNGVMAHMVYQLVEILIDTKSIIIYTNANIC